MCDVLFCSVCVLYIVLPQGYIQGGCLRTREVSSLEDNWGTEGVDEVVATNIHKHYSESYNIHFGIQKNVQDVLNLKPNN